MRPITATAALRFSARKKIQAKSTRRKVTAIRKTRKQSVSLLTPRAPRAFSRQGLVALPMIW